MSCPSDALLVFGKRMTVDEVLQIVVADQSYYGEDGGVTFSGGEVFQQRDFLARCLSACKKQGVRTCVESALHVPWATIEATLAHIDMMICDLKIMDTEQHRRLTGKSNSRILKNMSSLAEREMPLIIRVPVVPGCNDNVENITETARFIDQHLGNRVLQVQLLRYRPLGIEKYEALSMTYPMVESQMPTREESKHRIEELAALMNKLGVPAMAGTTYPLKRPH
jgi:pyruvate formate lyase activating enzyme